MKTSQWLQIALAATASFVTLGALSPTTAATFDSLEVNSNNFITVAAPFGNNQHQLLIIEQVSNRKPCWSESGSSPVTIEPLLLNFDFTGICGRSTDSNGYSIRMNGQDLGLDYLLRIVERNGELVLVGTHRTDRKAPDIEIGRTRGMGSGFDKIFLDPGWRLTRRTYQGKALGHIYLTTDSTSPVNQQANPNPQPLPPDSERELIFTKPQAGTTAPREATPTTSPQTLPLPATPAPTVPVFVVPTQPQAGTTAPGGATPATSPQTLPPPATPERQIPVFVTPRS